MDRLREAEDAERRAHDREGQRADQAGAERDEAQRSSREAFVAGAKWWHFRFSGSTQFPSETDEAEKEAEKRFPFAPWAHLEQIAALKALLREARLAAKKAREAGGDRSVSAVRVRVTIEEKEEAEVDLAKAKAECVALSEKLAAEKQAGDWLRDERNEARGEAAASAVLLDAAREEIAALKALLRRAPHGFTCRLGYCSKAPHNGYSEWHTAGRSELRLGICDADMPCDCWKSKIEEALRG